MSNVKGGPNLRVSNADLREFARIELPAFEDDVNKAVQAVGGDHAVAEAVQATPGELHFNLIALSSPSATLTSSTVNKNGLLLRIRRQRANPANTSWEVLGTVPRSLVFDSLVDYKVGWLADQYDSLLMLLTCCVQFIGNVAEQTTPEVLNAPPSTICREGVNKGIPRLILQEVVRKPAPTKATVDAPGAAEHAEIDPINPEATPRNPDKGMACFIKISDPVPLQHPRGEYPYENERGIVLVKLLKKLFSIIPSTWKHPPCIYVC
jgi:hypothetical protein